MARLKAQLAGEDMVFQTHLVKANREIGLAIEVCQRSSQDHLESESRRAYALVLRQVFALINGLGHLMAKDGENRIFKTHLAKANREIGLAVEVCQHFSRSSQDRFGSESRRARQYALVLRQALALINGLGHLTPMFDLTDPDMMPEDQRAEIAREAREQAAEPKAAPPDEGITDEAE